MTETADSRDAAGVYVSDEIDATFTVSVRDGRLMLQRDDDAEAHPLVRENRRLSLPDPDDPVRAEQGRVRSRHCSSMPDECGASGSIACRDRALSPEPESPEPRPP